jgi:hypothetical protein
MITTLNKTLSNPSQQFVAEQTAEEEQLRKIDEYHWKLVQEGLASGPPIPMTEEYWNNFLRKAEERRLARHKEAER